MERDDEGAEAYAEVLGELRAALKDARVLGCLHAVLSRLNKPSVQRADYIQVVAGLSELLRLLTGDTRAASAMLRLAIDLLDLDRGVTPKVLVAKSKGSGAKGKPTNQWLAVLSAVIALECLKRCRAEYPERTVANWLGKKGIELRVETLDNWWSDFSAGRIKNEMAQSLYDAWEKGLPVDRAQLLALAKNFANGVNEEGEV
jgi:hypothetical protein